MVADLFSQKILELVRGLSELRTHTEPSPEAHQKLEQLTADLSKIRNQLTQQLQLAETLLRDPHFYPAAVLDRLEGDPIPILQLILRSPSPHLIGRVMLVVDCMPPTAAKPLAQRIISIYEEVPELQKTLEHGITATATLLMSEAESALYSSFPALPPWAKIRLQNGQEHLVPKLLEAAQDKDWQVRAKAFSVLAGHRSLTPIVRTSPEFPKVAAVYQRALRDPEYQVVEAALGNDDAAKIVAAHFQKELAFILTSQCPPSTKLLALTTLCLPEAHPLKKSTLTTALPFIHAQDPALAAAAIAVVAECMSNQQKRQPTLFANPFWNHAQRTNKRLARKVLEAFLTNSPNAAEELQLAALKPFAIPNQLSDHLTQRIIHLAKHATPQNQAKALRMLSLAQASGPETQELAESLSSSSHLEVQRSAAELLLMLAKSGRDCSELF